MFDLDGTIYLGDHLLPGARRLVEELRARGTTVRFLSNNPTRDPEQYAAKLEKLGLPTPAGEIVNLSTDVRMALDAGVAAALVLTGETKADDLGRLAPSDSPSGCSAGGRMAEGFADGAHPLGAEPGDLPGAQRDADDRQAVEGEHARRGHAVRAVELHFGGDASDGSCRRHRKHLVQDWDGLVASEDQEGTAPGPRILVPPHLATCYHGSRPWRRSSASRRRSRSTVAWSVIIARSPHSSGASGGICV